MASYDYMQKLQKHDANTNLRSKFECDSPVNYNKKTGFYENINGSNNNTFFSFGYQKDKVRNLWKCDKCHNDVLFKWFKELKNHKAECHSY
jgi:hypothetical protein